MGIDSAKLRPNPFSSDDGSMRPELAAAFEQPETSRASAIVAALDRVIVPVVPHVHPGRDQAGGVAQHVTTEKNSIGTTDDDLVKTPFPGGRESLALFSSAQACAQWNPQARPVPASIKNVAIEALKNDVAQLTLDPGLETQTWIGRSAVIALASQTSWHAPWEDPQIREKILGALGEGLPSLVDVQLEPAGQGATAVVVTVENGATREAAVNAIQAVVAVIGSDEYVKARLDAVEVRPRMA